MRISQVRKLSAADRLVYWITERETIRLRKEAGQPRPWTDDEILHTYRFCNVRRMDDRVSRWLMDNWYQPHHGHKNMVAAVALARFINLPDALSEVGFPKRWDPKRILRVLTKRQERGQRVFNGAYIVTGQKGTAKVESVVNCYVQAMVDNPPEIDPSSMRVTWQQLLRYPGVASFAAGQIAADLRWAVPGSWLDRLEWAPLGPGSARGLARLLNGDDWPAAVSGYHRDPDGWLTDFREHVMSLVGSEVPGTITGRLEAMDLQNCLCEYDKYVRTLCDGRRPKTLYRVPA